MTYLPPDTYSDLLLADVARKIQLTGTDRDRALRCYRSVAAHIDREESPLHGRVALVYPQGSMAIDATILSGIDGDDRYDIDAIAELDYPLNTSPDLVLDVLMEALDAGIYKGKVTRQTRCVTVQLDEFHMDVTPMLRQHEKAERTGKICHHKPETGEKRTPVANPYGFAQYFIDAIPQVRTYFLPLRKSFVLAESAAADMRKAETEPLPDATPVQEKPIRLLGLQLLKRFVKLRYAKRSGRQPPSVYLAKIIADVPTVETTLVGELKLVTSRIIADIQQAKHRGQLIRHINPACQEDCFTDRWPENTAAQDKFLADMIHFHAQIEKLASRSTLEEKRDILNSLFGEMPVKYAFDELAKLQNSGMEGKTLRTAAGSGGVTVGSLLGGVAKASETPVPQQRFYSSER